MNKKCGERGMGLLIEEVHKCAMNRCCGPNYEAVSEVQNKTGLGKWNETAGNLCTPVMVVAKAPYTIDDAFREHGEGWKEIDAVWRNFGECLKEWGHEITEWYVTNAFLCKPTKEFRENTIKEEPWKYPTNREMKNCACFLSRQIEFVNPKAIIVLGAKACRTVSIATRRRIELSEHGGTAVQVECVREVFPIMMPNDTNIRKKRMQKHLYDLEIYLRKYLRAKRSKK